MIFEYIDADNSKEVVSLDLKVDITQEYKYLKASNKREFIQSFLPAFLSGQKLVLFDEKHKQLTDFYTKTDINTVEGIQDIDAQVLFFTSGSSGFPLGAFKSRENILQEIEVLKKLVKKKKINKIIVTVPFIHIYGILAGLLLPFYLQDITLVVKEDFLPYELLAEISSEECLIITTPVFIKALAKLNAEFDLSSSMFISSTGPLQSDDVHRVQTKYNTSVMQVFGSTETGGIAYKFGVTTKWRTLDKVKIRVDNERLSVESPFVSLYTLEGQIQSLGVPFLTEDIIELDSNTFTLLGRSNKLIKIAGKRISALAIESILEEIPQVRKAVICIVYKKDLLRSEQILITLEASEEIKKSLIRQKIKECYGTLSIPFSVEYIEKINLSSMGKKIIF